MNRRNQSAPIKENNTPPSTLAYLASQFKKIIPTSSIQNASTLLRIYNLFTASMLTQLYFKNLNYFKDNHVAFQEHILLIISHFLPALLKYDSDSEFHSVASFLSIYPGIFHLNQPELPFQSLSNLPVQLVNLSIHSHATLHLFSRKQEANPTHYKPENAFTIFNVLRILNFFMALIRLTNIDENNPDIVNEFIDAIAHLVISLIKVDSGLLCFFIYFTLNMWTATNLHNANHELCPSNFSLEYLDDLLHNSNLLSAVNMLAVTSIATTHKEIKILPDWMKTLSNACLGIFSTPPRPENQYNEVKKIESNKLTS